MKCLLRKDFTTFHLGLAHVFVWTLYFNKKVLEKSFEMREIWVQTQFYHVDLNNILDLSKPQVLQLQNGDNLIL